MARTLLLVALVHRFQGEYEKALKEMDDVQALEERALVRHLIWWLFIRSEARFCSFRKHVGCGSRVHRGPRDR